MYDQVSVFGFHPSVPCVLGLVSVQDAGTLASRRFMIKFVPYFEVEYPACTSFSKHRQTGFASHVTDC